MQETRRQILEILFESEQATVDEIVSNLRQLRGDKITSVTVRHHIARLQEEGLVSNPSMSHRPSPGRPRHIYELTNHGSSFFPNNYEQMTVQLLNKLNSTLPESTVNVIIEGIADDIANEACIPNGTLRERLDGVVEFLNHKGYEARWETGVGGFVLHTENCPYHHAAQNNESLCQLDMRLVSKILGVIPRLQSRISRGDETCSYLIPNAEKQ